MNYSLYISRRISPRGRKGRGAPAIKVAVTAVALSVAVMLAAIAIVTGFKREITAKVIGFNAHISLFSQPTETDDNNVISLSPSLKKILDDTPFVTDYSLHVSVPAIFKTKSDFRGIYFKSLEGRGIHDFLGSSIIEGSIPDYSLKESDNLILISDIVARSLGLKTGDRIDTYFMTNDVRVRPLRIAGIFNTHFDSYDKVYAYGSLRLIQKLAGLEHNQGTSIAIHTDNFNNIETYTLELHDTLSEALAQGLIYRPLRMTNALNEGAGYFQWLSLLDTNVVVVLALMTFVAVVTLISGLLIIIIDKKRFIGLLRALGAPVTKVRRIFVYLSVKITIIGLIIGNGLMLALLWLQDKYHFAHLDPDSYYIDFVPVQLSWPQVTVLNLSVLIVVYLCLILPSWLVARISPAETLRYE